MGAAGYRGDPLTADPPRPADWGIEIGYKLLGF
jgi:hypothetical protein